MQDLPEQEALTLATSFNFTGGQIENVLRKRTIRFVLDGTQPTLEDLVAYCQEETLIAKSATTPIGFRC